MVRRSSRAGFLAQRPLGPPRWAAEPLPLGRTRSLNTLARIGPSLRMPAPPLLGLCFGVSQVRHAVSRSIGRSRCAALAQAAPNAARYEVKLITSTSGAHMVASRPLPRWCWARACPANGCRSPGGSATDGFQGLPEGALDVEVWFRCCMAPMAKDGHDPGLFQS